MAKITIEELYRGEKYDIMSAVTAKALQLVNTEQDAFSYGFRLGVQLMAESFLLPIGEDE